MPGSLHADSGGGVLGLRCSVVTMLEGEVREDFAVALDVLRGGGVNVEEFSVPLIGNPIAVNLIVTNADL